MSLADLMEECQDKDPRDMEPIERVAFYSYQAHYHFEEVINTFDINELALVEQELNEMLEMARNAREKAEQPEHLALLQEIEAILLDDCQAFE